MVYVTGKGSIKNVIESFSFALITGASDFFSAKCSLKITNYGILLVLQTKEPFPTNVLSDCGYINYTGAPLLSHYD